MYEEDDTTSSLSRNYQIVSAKSVDVADCDEAKAPKLCGYLNKLVGKGPLKGFKTRWFVYDPRKCYLYYFKTPQDALPLGYIEVADACFTYDVEEEGQFEIRTTGKEFLLKAPNRQVMQYWLQQLQQKRWEFSNTRGGGNRDGWSSPIPQYPHTGLVAKDTDALIPEQPNESMERVRSDFAVEADANGLVGVQSARNPTAHNFFLKQWGTELRNSMSHLRPGRGGENRRSVFYTASNEEWEMVDHPMKDTAEVKPPAESQRRESPSNFHRHSIGSAFTFDFRSTSRVKRRSSRSAEPSPVEAADLQLRLQSQQEEQAHLQEELTSQKELVRLLQQTLRSLHCERRLAADPGGMEAAAALVERDTQIRQLCGHMERLALEKESLRLELRNLKVKVGDINDQLGMLMETIQAKDEVIMKLSQQGQDGSAEAADCSSPTAREQQELHKLKDSLQGYKSQNNFLNKEILELTVLRRNSENREKALEAKYISLEAKMCQVESKYLILLQEVKTPLCSMSDQDPARELISRLLEDALQVDSGDHQEHAVLKPHPVSEYDIYGFKTVPEEEDEEEKLVAKVRALELRSLSLTDQEVSVGVKWENYLAGTMNREMVRSPELKVLIRSGVPHPHRSKIWSWCVNLHVKKIRECQPADYYENLLCMAREKPNPASKQIELDLLRTLPNNKHYASPSADGIQKLRNVLLAFSWRNPDIGYCQGLNRLAAIALLYLEQEEAFWCLITIVEVFMPRDYYTKTLLGSQVDQRVFKDLMNEKLPRLHAHFEQYKVDFSLITFNWFLVVFVDSVVSDILFKIWDAFLYEGPKIIFRFALALFKCKEEEFLKLQDAMGIFKYLRYFTRTILDARKLMNMAFVDMNPFPLRQIQNRRTFHLEKVRLELTELEAIRQTFLRERETSQDGRAVISDDDEDN
ncbi:TBC1 domain family member 2B [Electrophorus electricus]|uniref:TBC1 domain family, member 2B n=1 Tax=Electrophorus electricus TaxID=8005 RepID=A0A4W4DUK9_ELEEL|nr:TBC1 domain family member 2B [Electrophorus electricus]